MVCPQRGLVAQTVLVNLEFAWNPLSVQTGANKDVRQLLRTPIANFNQIILSDNILHLLSGLLLFNGILLHLLDLVADLCHPLRIGTPVRKRAKEVRVYVLKRQFVFSPYTLTR